MDPVHETAPRSNSDPGARGGPIADACRDWGFFKLTGHGVSAVQYERFMAATRKFFDSAPAIKQSVERTEENPWGFFDRKLTKNKPDCKEIFDFGIDQDPAAGTSVSQWPDGIDDFKPAMTDWFEASYALSMALMERLLPTLGAPPDALHAEFQPTHSSFLRLNYYPVCANLANPAADEPSEGHLGISHHTDAGALTVLV